MTDADRALLAEVSRHLRAVYPIVRNGRYDIDPMTWATYDDGEIRVYRRARPDGPFSEWPTRYSFRTVTEAVDLAVALGLLPAHFSSAYREGFATASALAVLDDEFEVVA